MFTEVKLLASILLFVGFSISFGASSSPFSRAISYSSSVARIELSLSFLLSVQGHSKGFAIFRAG